MAAVPAQLSAALTSGGSGTRAEAAVRLAEPDFKDAGSPEMFFISLVPKEETESDAFLCAISTNSYAERQELIFLLAELRFKPRQADAQARQHERMRG